MKFALRSRPVPSLPGLRGPARVHRRTASLLGKLKPGDIAVIDHVDMDRETAQALVDSGVAAVINAGPMISGRYPNLGPQRLVEAGVLVIDRASPEAFELIKDGATLRLHEGVVHVGEESELTGREVTAGLVEEEMAHARGGLIAQLESFTHNSTEFLRREQDVLLHGRGVPEISTDIAGRPVVVVVRSHGWQHELHGIKAFLREQKPVLIAVDAGADALDSAGYKPDVVVVSGTQDELPATAVLRKANDVVVVVERGASRALTEHFERMSIRPLRFETSATTEDAALLLASAQHASLIVGVGLNATLAEFLDRHRPGLASTFLTRLKVGPDLVDAAVLPHLYDGAVRPWHLLAVLVAGVVSVAAAVSVTPVGQEMVHDLIPALSHAVDTVRGMNP